MRSWKKPTPETVERVLSSFEKETDRQYFFARLKNPLWIRPLADRGCFAYPPNIKKLPGGNFQCPFWPELEYLKNVCKDAPSDIVDDIIQIVLELPQVENPMVYEEIVDMALNLDGVDSGRLKPRVLEYARLDRQFRAANFPRLIEKWTVEGQTEAALELANILVQFAPDPKAQEKQNRYSKIDKNQTNEDKDNVTLMMASKLEPVPRFSSIYMDVLNEGLRPLVEKEPYKVALMLIDVTDTMIRLGKHEDDLASGRSTDFLEIWCPRLNKPRRDYPDLRESLVHTLTYACESVWNRSRDLFGDLDAALRNHRWDVFKRVRQHLYAIHLGQHTREWIREFIFAHDDYGRLQYGYEFQQMVRLACENFGAELLTREESTRIFDAILRGPSSRDFRLLMGDEFTKKAFEQWRRKFHRKQLRPFAQLLFGKYSDYFQDLEGDETEDEITDESYSRSRKSEGGMVTSRSPKSPQELAALSDVQLLEYINEWQDEHRPNDDWLTDINIEALAAAFEVVFRESIIPQVDRLDFWMSNRQNILRPIYVRAMIHAMRGRVKARYFDKLEQWFPFCEWVLSHSDPRDEHPYGVAQLWDRSRETPRWHTARRAVCDFVEKCLEPNARVPITFRAHIAAILELLCTQYDWLLDRDERTPLNVETHLNEAVDTTRGRALENLVEFGFWLRRHDKEMEIADMNAILDKRFASATECRLQPTEYAILGRLYQSIFDLDGLWAECRRSFVFPQHNVSAWFQAFASFLRYSRPQKGIFFEMRYEFEFALDNLERLEQHEQLKDDLKIKLGLHLFRYYVWGVLQLDGTDSLFCRFYLATDNERGYWSGLFTHVGRILRNSEKQIDQVVKDRVVAFFEWRLKAEEASELRKFSEWLEAECLDTEWRLEALSRVLKIRGILDETENHEEGRDDDPETWLPYDATRLMRAMLPEHTPRVIECFAKLTNVMPKIGAIHVPTDDAKGIINAGLDHDDETVRENARQARENLLKRGYFSVLD